jgi:hypothetical protein
MSTRINVPIAYKPHFWSVAKGNLKIKYHHSSSPVKHISQFRKSIKFIMTKQTKNSQKENRASYNEYPL